MTQKRIPLLVILITILIAAFASTAGVRAQTPVATPTGEVVIDVQTAEPDESGQVIHEVQPGQSAWAIAIAYGTTINELAAMNNLDETNPVIYPGQKLLIRAGAAATETPAISSTPEPSITHTPRNTATRRPTSTERPTSEPTMTATPTPKPFFPKVDVFQSVNRRSMGIGIIVVCVLGLVMVAVSSLRKH